MIQFISTNPTSEAMRRNRQEDLAAAGQTLGFTNTMQEMGNRQELMRNRRGAEEAQRGIARIFAEPDQAASAVPGVTAAPEPVVARAAPAPLPQIFPPNPAETGSTEPQAAVTPGPRAALVNAPAAPAAAPAATVSPISTFSSYNDKLRRAAALAGDTPGAGAVAMGLAQQMGQRSEIQRKDVEAKMGEAFKHIAAGDVELAKEYAKSVGIDRYLAPIFSNPKALYTVKSTTDVAKGMGLKDLDAAVFVNSVMEGLTRGVPYQDALQAAAKAVTVQASKKPAPGAPIESKTGIYQRTQGGDVVPVTGPDGKVLMPTDRRMFLPAQVGGAGGGSKQQQYAQWRIRTLTDAGVNPKEANRIVAGGTAMSFGPRDVARMATSLMKTLDDNMQPVYKNIGEATQAAQAALGMASNAPGAGGDQTPPPNRIKFDAQGNQLK